MEAIQRLSPWGPCGHEPRRRASKAPHPMEVRVRVQQGRREVVSPARALLTRSSHQDTPSEEDSPPCEPEASSDVWIEEMFRNGIIPAKVPVHRSPAVMFCPLKRARSLP